MEDLTGKRSRIRILLALSLGVLTVAAFWGVWNNEFVNYDDSDYVTENAVVQKGLTWNGIRWALTTDHAGNWHPLTWVSHMLDAELYGLNPTGHHLTSLLLHAVNSILLFFLLTRLTQQAWPSAFVAALFALHPLHVESVAWVAERKDVLSTFFLMLTLLFYTRYVERQTWGRFAIVFLSLALGLMAKPMLVTLPFLLLLLDFWPLKRYQPGRLSLGEGRKSRNSMSQQSRALTFVRLVREKIPLFLLVLASSIVTYVVQKRGGNVQTWEVYSFGTRIVNAFVSYIAYIGKAFYPTKLAVFYPHPGYPLFDWRFFGAAAILIAVTFSAVRMLKRRPYLLVGWFWYLGTLVPVIGFIQVGAQAIADRYTYVPLIGVFIIFAWGTAELTSRFRYRKAFLGIFAGAILVPLIILTNSQVRYWKDGLTLFDHTLKVSPDNCVAHNGLGVAFDQKGMLDEAIIHYSAAVRIAPNYGDAHNNLGVAYAKKEMYEQAIVHFTKALQLFPNDPVTEGNLKQAQDLLRRKHSVTQSE